MTFAGDRERIRGGTEHVVERLIECRRSMATRLERRADERIDDEPGARMDSYETALEHLNRARELAAQFRAGSTASIDHQCDRLRAKQSLERVDRLVAALEPSVRSKGQVTESSPSHLGVIAKEAWRLTETSEATLRVDSSTVLRVDKLLLTEVFENIYATLVAQAEGEATVRVGTTDEGFYVETDGPLLPALVDGSFDAGLPTSAAADPGLSANTTIIDEEALTISVTEGASGGTRFEVTSGDLRPTV